MKTFNGAQWSELMSKLDRSKIKLLKDSHGEQGPIINIRHDVDNDLEASVRMADAEAISGIKSTYFFLDTAMYWHSPEFEQAVNMIALWGHEIAWHNNAITAHLRTGKHLFDCINEPLTRLRSIAEVTGTASHGDPLCYDKGYLNYYCFRESRRHPKFTNPDFTLFGLQDFGLDYEAYHTDHKHYISDSGGEWQQNNEAVMSAFLNTGSKLQILIHPQHWQL